MTTVATTKYASYPRHRRAQHPVLIALAAVLVAILAGALLWPRVFPPTPPPQNPQTIAEHTYLDLMYPIAATPESQQKSELKLGYKACQIMTQGSADHAAYRKAVGILMAAQVSPSLATMVAHNALVSGLCLQR